MADICYDVAVIGGGPGGATLGAFLKKYNPDLSVAIFERENFPRDHVGESQLPVISNVLDELGIWSRVEEAGFPIKIGATYRWGLTKDLWDFEFLSEFHDEPRPGKFEGQRRKTAFQVDRAIYDKILLDHARERGCKVFEGAKVLDVSREGNKVKGLKIENPSHKGNGQPDKEASTDFVTARFYVDASGHSGILRRAMGVEIDVPSHLQNVAIWDYWQNADWAVTVGQGGTRILVLSLGYGWMWFIPLGATRTSIGLVVPKDHLKSVGKKPADLYKEALESEPLLQSLMKNASSENRLQTTKDWSFVARKLCGENWFLVGESAGFADPILSAGLSLTHVGAQELATTLIELDRGEHGKKWLREEYETRQQGRLNRHIRFADFWYTANVQFTELEEFTREIAEDAGLSLSAKDAWQWLGTGGFINVDLSFTGFGGYDIHTTRKIVSQFTAQDVDHPLVRNNMFQLNLAGAQETFKPGYHRGKIYKQKALVRRGKMLMLTPPVALTLNGLSKAQHVLEIIGHMTASVSTTWPVAPETQVDLAMQTLEAMVADGWVTGWHDKTRESIPARKFVGRGIHPNEDLARFETFEPVGSDAE